MTLNSLNKQSGASAPLVLVFLGMSAVILTLAFKLYPPIFEHWQVEAVVESFQDDNDLAEITLAEIEKRFNKRLVINNIRNFKSSESLSVTDEDGLLLIAVDYEVRIPVYRNIDAIMTFEKSFEKNL